MGATTSASASEGSSRRCCGFLCDTNRENTSTGNPWNVLEHYVHKGQSIWMTEAQTRSAFDAAIRRDRVILDTKLVLFPKKGLATLSVWTSATCNGGCCCSCCCCVGKTYMEEFLEWKEVPYRGFDLPPDVEVHEIDMARECPLGLVIARADLRSKTLFASWMSHRTQGLNTCKRLLTNDPASLVSAYSGDAFSYGAVARDEQNYLP